MFEYPRKHEMYRLVFVPFQPKNDDSSFALGATDWRVFYGYIEEELPLGMPEPLRRSAHTKCFVDANHYGNVVTWSLHTGVLIYVMNAPIIWFSNNKNTVDSSNFGSKLGPMWVARDLNVVLHYKLRICTPPPWGIPKLTGSLSRNICYGSSDW